MPDGCPDRLRMYVMYVCCACMYVMYVCYKLCPDPVHLSSVQYRPICELVTLTTIVLLDAHIVQTICSRMLEAES